MKTIIANAAFTFQIPDEITLPPNVYVYADKEKVELRSPQPFNGFEVIATVGQAAVAWDEIHES